MVNKSLMIKVNRNAHGAVFWLGALLFLTVSSSAMASSSLSMSRRVDLLGGVAKEQPLSSVRLAGIRGKFINGEKIVYFGLSMSSGWQNKLMTNMFTVSANMEFSIQGNKPTFLIWNSCSNCNQTTVGGWTPKFSGAFPFNNSHGVKQDIQVAGDNNQVTNMVGIQLAPYDGSSSGMDPQNAHQPPYNVLYLDGSSASGGLDVGNGLISLGITVPTTMPGDQFIGQQIGSDGITQYAGLNSDANVIMNNLTMQVGTVGVANAMYSQQLNLLLQSMPGVVH